MAPSAEIAAFALGSNLGDRVVNLSRAREALASRMGPLMARSRIYETDPIGPPGQGAYLNQVVTITARERPEVLLAEALAIERALGRERTARWGARTIDLDLLLCGDQVRAEPGLTLPHPRLAERPFVLVPLAELMPTWRHPQLGRMISELLGAAGNEGVQIYQGDGEGDGI